MGIPKPNYFFGRCLFWAVCAALLLLALNAYQLRLKWEEVFGFAGQPGPPLVSGLLLGQSLGSGLKRTSYVDFRIATYLVQSEGRLSVSLLSGSEAPGTQAELDLRTLSRVEIETGLLVDNALWRWDLPSPGLIRPEGLYLVFHGTTESTTAKPVTIWLDDYAGWTAGPADILTVGRNGQLTKKAAGGHLVLGLGYDDPAPTALQIMMESNLGQVSLPATFLGLFLMVMMAPLPFLNEKRQSVPGKSLNSATRSGLDHRNLFYLSSLSGILMTGLFILAGRPDPNETWSRFQVFTEGIGDFLYNEDMVFESLTALLLILTAVMFFRSAAAFRTSLKIRPQTELGRRFVPGCLWGSAAFFFLLALEELSWGQRIFGWSTPAFWKNINAQNETNLHNLVYVDIDTVYYFSTAALLTVLVSTCISISRRKSSVWTLMLPPPVLITLSVLIAAWCLPPLGPQGELVEELVVLFSFFYSYYFFKRIQAYLFKDEPFAIKKKGFGDPVF